MNSQKIIYICFLILSSVHSQNPEITRDDMVQTAVEYMQYWWIPNDQCVNQKETAEKPTNSSSPKRINFYTPFIGLEQQGMAYAIACWNTIYEFETRISDGLPVNLTEYNFNGGSEYGPMTLEFLAGTWFGVPHQYMYSVVCDYGGAIDVKIYEKYSGNSILEHDILTPGNSNSNPYGPSGQAFTQTLILSVQPVDPAFPISYQWSLFYGKPANQDDRWSSGAYSVHWPGSETWAVGIDCSGLVGRCWQLVNKPYSQLLLQNYYPITAAQLKKGDIFVRWVDGNSDNHAMIVTEVYKLLDDSWCT